MIIGLGSDIVDSRRIGHLVDTYGLKFLNRVFTLQEQERCLKRSLPYSSFAKIFAAKEAAIKAVRIPTAVKWHDFEVVKGEHGEPYLRLSGRALSNVTHRLPQGLVLQTHLTISDEPPYAYACVIIEAIGTQI